MSDLPTRPTMGQIPTLPIFFKLRGRRVVLAGGGEPAIWKAEVLCAAGARVDVLATEPCAGLESLAASLGDDVLRLVRRSWRPDDLPDAAIALGAIEDDQEAERFRSAAVAARVPVNVVDKPALCDFQFGTLVDRSPLLLAITTDGAAPVFGQAIRARIEALLPEQLRGWAEAAKAWRPAVQARGWGFRQRRRFWEVFAERAMRLAEQVPQAADLEACLHATVETESARTGSLTLVGCGGGSLDDVTFGAVRALQSADTILFDDDVGPEIINLARREAAKIPASSKDVEVDLVRLVARGSQVAWLGTGDASTCHHWGVRASRLARLQVETNRLSGVGRCPRCPATCRFSTPPVHT